MTAVQGSLFCCLLSSLWAGLVSAWQSSRTRRLCASLGRSLASLGRGSALGALFTWEGALLRAWRGSFFCRLFTGILNLPCAFAKWLYKVLEPLLEGSLAWRVLAPLGRGTYLFLGLSMLLLLSVPHESWNNAYTLLCMYALIPLFLLGCAPRREYRLELDALGPYYTLFLGFLVFGLVGSLSTGLSMRFFVFHMIAFLITLFTVSSVHSTRQLTLLLGVTLAGLAIASLYGCYQGYQGVDVVASQQDMVLNSKMPGRVYSFFDNPNNFAEILVMLMPFFPALFLCSKGWRGKAASALGFVLCLVAIGLTYSRSGWIGLAIALLVFLVLHDWRFLPLFLAVGLCAIPFLPQTILDRILTIGDMRDTSTLYRFSIYQDTAYLIGDYGLRGVGLGTDVMRQVFLVYPTMFDGNYPIHTHNNYLQMWGELGFFGALTYLGMVLFQLKSGLKAYRASHDASLRHILAAALGAFAGILVIGVAEYTWFYPRNMFVFFFLFGVIAACIKLAPQEGPSRAL